MRRGVLPIWVALLALAAAPAASAAPERIAVTQGLGAGPALVDGGSSWVDLRGSDHALRSRLASGGTRTLLRGSGRDTALSGSDRRLAFSDGSGSFTGPLAGPLSRLSGCGPRPVAASGDSVASVDCQGRVVVRDLRAGGASRTFGAPSSPRRLALSGRWLAEEVGSNIRVWDWVTGVPAYLTGGADAFDLGSGGELAAVRLGRSCATSRLDLHTRTSPGGRRLGLTPCTAQVAVAAGRIAAIAPAARGQRALTLTRADDSRRDLVLVGGRRVVTGDLDLDSGRAAYALRRCDARRDLLTVSLADPGARRAISSRCLVSILTSRARLTPSSRLTFGLRCRRGCAGRVFLRLGRRNGSPARIAFPPARRARRIAFRLGGTLPRTLRSGRVIRATLVVRTTDLSGRKRITRRAVRLSG